MKEILIGIVLITVLCLGTCSAGNVDFVKERAEATWKANGYEVIGYEGFAYGNAWPAGTSRGGAKVWYSLKRIPDNGVRYSGYLQRWENEVHVYGPTPVIDNPVVIKESK